jgi:SAM-dependent methyltransferase
MENSEFDRVADKYHAMHAKNISASGEKPDFFASYKIADLARIVAEQGRIPNEILDFGSGVGNSIPWFRKYFPNSYVTCADVSSRSIAVSQKLYAGRERYAEILDGSLPFDDDVFDVVFSACVFHHIPHQEHIQWFKEALRVTRPGGLLVVFEHNPWNPLTVHAVNTCPFDINARLIESPELARTVCNAGWQSVKVRYRVFFPRFLSALRRFEEYLVDIPLGAQYSLIAEKKWPE